MKKSAILVSVALVVGVNSPAQAATITGSQGQALSVSKTTAKSGSLISVTGKRFDETSLKLLDEEYATVIGKALTKSIEISEEEINKSFAEVRDMIKKYCLQFVKEHI